MTVQELIDALTDAAMYMSWQRVGQEAQADTQVYMRYQNDPILRGEPAQRITIITIDDCDGSPCNRRVVITGLQSAAAGRQP